MLTDDALIRKMHRLIEDWEQSNDRRVIFLSCYIQMTYNMRLAVQQAKFHDSAWVGRLIDRFADYYFQAQENYAAGHIAQTPHAWRSAFEAVQDSHIHVLQHLLLGVNAHINYDLNFALEDALRDSWTSLPAELRRQRYEDHVHVNDVIAQTVDSVQDMVVNRYSPQMGKVDWLLGPVDEYLASKLLANWRERVWRHAIQLVESQREQRTWVMHEIETNSIEWAKLIRGKELFTALSDLI